MPDNVDSLVFIDALVPRDGESCWHLVNDEERQWYIEVDETGYGVPPMPFFDSRATAHPLASFLQPIKLSLGSEQVPASRFRVRAEMAWGFGASAVIRTGS
jgi:hypothetical protein